MKAKAQQRSLRRYLLLGILLPVGLLVSTNTVSLYSQALAAINTAYDRTLLASTKSIGEQLDVTGYDAQATLRVTVPYAALEAFEADNQSRLFYRVSSLSGALVSGYADLPFWRGQISAKPAYSALVDFYDDTFEGTPVRVAVLMQPVASSNGRAMAVIQVAETLELRRTLARSVLFDTLWRQALLLAVIALVVMVVVQRATRLVRRLSQQLRARPEGDLNPINAPDALRELMPLVDATNAVMTRLDGLLENQKRFVRDAAHQLRTPLAVLKVQVQSAMRGDTPPAGSLTVCIVRDATHAALSLSDSGPGIDAELSQRLFQPFSSGHVARGSGLGLAICKEIVQVLGGTIALSNRVQHGVVTGLDATVRLPLLV